MQFGTICTIKKSEYTHGGVILLVKLQARKGILHYGCFSHFQLVQMVGNQGEENLRIMIQFCSN